MSRPAKKPKTTIMTLRVTHEQKARLIELAEGSPVSRFMVDAILLQGKRPPKSLRFVDRELIGQLIGFLGKSRLASNLNQLAKAANSGSLPVNDDVLKAINEAVSAILWMRDVLIKALGLKTIHKDSEASNDPKL